MSRVLILTQPQDAHAYVVADMLRQKGGEAVLWFTSDFPMMGTETVSFDDGMHIRIGGPGGAIDFSRPFDVVWRRRPVFQLDGERLHPADREYAETACHSLREGLLTVLCPDAFWVNPATAVRANEFKVTQIAAARATGLDVPDSLFTNDPAEIRAFIRAHGGRIAFKPFRGMAWRDGDQYFMPYTAVLTEEQLVADELLMAAPGIYQTLIPKAYELRVTFIGDRPFAVKVLSQQTRFGQVDWRKAYGELRMETYELPAGIAERCRALMRGFGLVFGCFDFIVTEDGRYVFLEVNQMGQFLFAERYTGMPMGDAFAELLMQRRPDFVWPNPAGTLRYEAVGPAIAPQMNDDEAMHAAVVSHAWNEAAAP